MDDIRLLEIATNRMCIEKDKQRPDIPAGIPGHEATEAGAAGVVPNFEPALDAAAEADAQQVWVAGGHHGGIRDGVVVRRRQLLGAVAAVPIEMIVVVIVHTGQARALRHRVPLTQKHGAQRLAEEPLTFFPDAQCCPPSPAMPRAALARARLTDAAAAATRGR